MEPTFWNVPQFLSEHFPELAADIEEEYLFWCDSGMEPYPHTFLEQYLLPKLTREPDARAPQLLEQLLVAGDEDLASAALMSTVDIIAETDILYDLALPHLGPTAREWTESLRAKYLKRREEPA